MMFSPKLNFKDVTNVKTGISGFVLIVLLFLSLLSFMGPASAAVNAQITGTNPPSGVTVEAGGVFPLMVAVTYSVPPDAAQNVGGYVLWLTLDGKSSNVIPFGGPGSYTFQFTVPAPSIPGTYTLKISLYILTKPDYQQQMAGKLFDTATFTYQVKPRVVTDWEVERVWITPESPAPDEEVSFHARIALRSTTSTQSLIVEVMCHLDNQQFIRTLMTLNFKPTPSYQDIMVPKKWEATEGEHELRFTVDPLRKHNDPNLQNNIRSFRFRVEPFYAVIHDVKIPPEVDSGEVFDIVVGVEYSFPDNTELKITNIFPLNGTGEEQFDTVSGHGINTYIYSVEAPSLSCGLPRWRFLDVEIRDSDDDSDEWPEPFPEVVWEEVDNTVPVNGSAQVEFDRGSGWQHTDPGWHMDYVVQVRRPTYYAVFDSVEVTYLGVDRPGNPLKSDYGRFSITMQVRYYLPLETGLRITVSGYNGSAEILRLEETITQTEIVERTVTYVNEYSVPLASLREGSYAIAFYATVEFMCEGAWHHGDDGSSTATFSLTFASTEVAPRRSILDDITKRFEDFYDWWRGIFE